MEDYSNAFYSPKDQVDMFALQDYRMALKIANLKAQDTLKEMGYSNEMATNAMNAYQPQQDNPLATQAPPVQPSQPNMLAGQSAIPQQPPNALSPHPEWGNQSMRADGTPKQNGFLGALPIKTPDGKTGVASEYSIGVQINGKEVEIPTLVPTLTKEEQALMVNDIIPNHKPVPPSIQKKAIDYAKQRIAQGKNPFASDAESPNANAQPSPQVSQQGAFSIPAIQQKAQSLAQFMNQAKAKGDSKAFAWGQQQMAQLQAQTEAEKEKAFKLFKELKDGMGFSVMKKNWDKLKTLNPLFSLIDMDASTDNKTFLNDPSGKPYAELIMKDNGEQVVEKLPVKDQFTEPYEKMIGGKKILVQKNLTTNQEKPVASDVSVTVKPESEDKKAKEEEKEKTKTIGQLDKWTKFYTDQNKNLEKRLKDGTNAPSDAERIEYNNKQIEAVEQAKSDVQTGIKTPKEVWVNNKPKTAVPAPTQQKKVSAVKTASPPAGFTDTGKTSGGKKVYTDGKGHAWIAP